MKERSHSPFEAAMVICADVWYSTIFSGAPSFAAAALPSSAVTPRAWPVAGSRVVQNADGDGPTATATRSAPVGATSATGTDGAVAQAESSSAASAAAPFARDGISAARRAVAAAIELHGLAGERHVRLHLHRLEEGLRLGAGLDLALHRPDLVGVRRDHRLRLDQVVDDVCRLGRASREAVADVYHDELRVIVVAHHALH